MNITQLVPYGNAISLYWYTESAKKVSIYEKSTKFDPDQPVWPPVGCI